MPGFAEVPAPPDDRPRRVQDDRAHGNVGTGSGSLGEGLPHGRLKPGLVASHRPACSLGSQGRVERSLQRGAESETTGNTRQYLIGEQIEIPGQGAKVHLI
jgi:hypothetical protein